MNSSLEIIVHKEDIPENILASLGDEVAVDTETLGLNLNRDRLCLVQLKGKNSNKVHLVQFASSKYDSPNLIKLFNNDNILKLYHYARFDIAVILKFLGALSVNNYCTKIASIIARTYSNKHGLKEICQELLGITLSKAQQSSYWGEQALSEEQKLYAASDVLYLSSLKEKLNAMLEKEKRLTLAQSCFSFIATRSLLDVLGWNEIDVFAHSIS